MKAILFTMAMVAFNHSYSQDLTSINVGTNLPEYTYNSSTKELTVQMTIRNLGFFNASAYECPLVAKKVGSSDEYELDRLYFSGLPYPNGNTLEITGWVVDVSTISAMPSGTYRLEARINDNQLATESNYTNNIEYFGQESFVYQQPSSASIDENTSNLTLKAFPNPASNSVQISSNEDLVNQPFSVTVYSLNGQEKLTIENNLNLDIHSLSSGVYIAVVKTTQGSSPIRIIKE